MSYMRLSEHKRPDVPNYTTALIRSICRHLYNTYSGSRAKCRIPEPKFGFYVRNIKFQGNPYSRNCSDIRRNGQMCGRTDGRTCRSQLAFFPAMRKLPATNTTNWLLQHYSSLINVHVWCRYVSTNSHAVHVPPNDANKCEISRNIILPEIQIFGAFPNTSDCIFKSNGIRHLHRASSSFTLFVETWTLR